MPPPSPKRKNTAEDDLIQGGPRKRKPTARLTENADPLVIRARDRAANPLAAMRRSSVEVEDEEDEEVEVQRARERPRNSRHIIESDDDMPVVARLNHSQSTSRRQLPMTDVDDSDVVPEPIDVDDDGNETDHIELAQESAESELSTYSCQ